MPIPVIAHRTCPLDAPENSLAGIRKAGEFLADGVEVDVRRSLGGVPILLHDRTPWRTAHLPGPVRLYPFAVLRRLRLQGTEERLPSLADAFDTLPGGLFMAVEIKDASASSATLRLIRERRLEGRVLLWSYRERAVRFFAERAPEIETSLLRDDTDPEGLARFLSDAAAWGARGISAHHAAINPPFVAAAHERGLKVYSMIGDLGSVAKKVASRLDGIVTDQPREVRAIVGAIGSTSGSRR
jgi:glycerophosphoryl diester phosphodiesterase